MVSLRKLFLIPAALVLVSGIASAVVPTISCTLTPNSLQVLRAEGRTELLPPVAYACTISNGSAVVADTAPFQLQVITTGPMFTSATVEPTITITPGTGAIYTLKTATMSGNVMTFTGVNLPNTTVAGTFGMSISGLRVDATAMTQASTLGLSVFTTLTDGTKATSGAIFLVGALPLAPISQITNLATALKSLTVTDSYSVATPATAIALTACQTDGKVDLTKTGTAYDAVTFAPVLSSSFTSTYTGGAPIVGAVATRLAISFGNIPAGVTLYVPLAVGILPHVIGSAFAELLTGYDSTTLAGGFPASLTAGTTDLLFPVPASGIVVYQVTDPGNGTTSFTMPTYYLANGPVLSGAVNVMAGYAPVGGTTVPRFMPLGTVSTGFVTEGPCSATLFFPYVVAGGGYDTGIAISSSGVLGDASKAASGQCVISFMGKGAPMTTKTLDVTVGQTNAFDIVGSMPTANFYGYAVAKCNFLNASGYAYVANSTGGTASYLPLNK